MNYLLIFFLLMTTFSFCQDTIYFSGAHWSINSCKIDTICYAKLRALNLPMIHQQMDSIELVFIESLTKKHSAIYTSCRLNTLVDALETIHKIEFDTLTPNTNICSKVEYGERIKNDTFRVTYLVIHRRKKQ